MSIKIMSWVWETSPAAGRELLVELALADFADDSGRCWPAVDTVAIKARCTGRHVQNTIHNMCAAGRLEVVPSAGPHGVNVYRFVAESAGVKPFHPEITNSPGVKKRARRGEATDKGGEISMSVISPDPSVTTKEPSQEDPSSEPPAARELAAMVAAATADRPYSFALYEDSIGLISGVVRDALIEMEATYPASYVVDAFKEAKDRGARNIRYVQAILARWVSEGRRPKHAGKEPEAGSARAHLLGLLEKGA